MNGYHNRITYNFCVILDNEESSFESGFCPIKRFLELVDKGIMDRNDIDDICWSEVFERYHYTIYI